MTDSYTDVFGGSPVQPADVSYNAIALAANTTLVWPIANQDTANVVARINDVTPEAGSLSLTMPDATQVSPGQDALFANVGANAFTLKASDGTEIATVASSAVIYLYLTDNTTAAGSWRVTTYASTTTTANAASLAGQGLTTIAGTLNQESDVSTFTVDTTAGNGDRGNTLVSTAGAITLSFTAATTLGNGWFVNVRNSGSGALTLDPNGAELIDGAATKTLNAGESCTVICSGSAFYTVGYGRTVTSSFTRLVKSVAGSTDVTLTATEAANQIQEYTGALTGNINVIVPTSVAEYWVFNNTSGSFTLTVKTSAGTGITVTQSTRTILYCDGTNVVQAQASTSGTVTAVDTGTGLTGGPITATGTIALANTAVSAGSYGSASAVPVLTVDAQGRITNATTADLGTIAVLNATGLTTAINEASVSVASATSTVSIGTATGNYTVITGTTRIYAFDTIQAGTRRELKFSAALPLTSSTNVILPGGADILTAAGDAATAISEGSGSWRFTDYQRASGLPLYVPGIVGNLRNLRVSVAPSGKTCSWSVDEIIVETALGGLGFRGASKTFAFDGATTGANGMGTGSMPTSGNLAVYAIYNPTADTWACVGVHFDSATEICPSGSMPSGYTASALIWHGKTDGSGNFIAFAQKDRRVWRALGNVLSGGTATTYTSVDLSSIVPPTAKTVSGVAGVDTGTTNLGLSVASDSSGTAEQAMAAATAGGFSYGNYFGSAPLADLPMMTAQTLYYKVTSSGSARIDINGYSF